MSLLIGEPTAAQLLTQPREQDRVPAPRTHAPTPPIGGLTVPPGFPPPEQTASAPGAPDWTAHPLPGSLCSGLCRSDHVWGFPSFRVPPRALPSSATGGSSGSGGRAGGAAGGSGLSAVPVPAGPSQGQAHGRPGSGRRGARGRSGGAGVPPPAASAPRPGADLTEGGEVGRGEEAGPAGTPPSRGDLHPEGPPPLGASVRAPLGVARSVPGIGARVDETWFPRPFGEDGAAGGGGGTGMPRGSGSGLAREG